jgi:drug/metabolite transporter (DMT)-like permease
MINGKWLDRPIDIFPLRKRSPMTSFYLPFAITVGGMLLYHLSQKSIPKEMNPFYATAVAYVMGIVACAILGFTYAANRSVVSSLKLSNWAVLGMGIGAAAIEVGFMLAYRMGWRISLTAIATNVAATVVLIPIGLLVFREHLSPRNILGVAFCIIGLLLVVRD